MRDSTIPMDEITTEWSAALASARLEKCKATTTRFNKMGRTFGTGASSLAPTLLWYVLHFRPFTHSLRSTISYLPCIVVAYTRSVCTRFANFYADVTRHSHPHPPCTPIHSPGVFILSSNKKCRAVFRTTRLSLV